MKRPPRWVWVLGTAVLIAVVLAVVAPYLLDLDRYKTLIVAAVEKETGRKVRIGKLRAKLLPSVGFVIEEFALGNPRGFPEGNLLTAEAIRGSLAWLPLLKREFQISSVEVERPHLFLLEDDRGKVNYQLEAPKQPGQKAPATGASFKVADIDSIEVSEAQLTLGRVTGSRRRVVPILKARNLSVTLEDIALDAKRLKEWRAEADLDGVVLELAGIKAPLEFKSGDVELNQGALESEFEAELGKITRAKGKLKVADVEKAVAQFELSAPLVDLGALAAASAKSEAVPATGAGARKSELLAKGRLSAERLRYAPYEVTGARADLRVYTDRIEFGPVSAALYGGTLQSSGRLDTRQAPERFTANAQLTGLDVAKAVAASPQTKGKMTGTAEMKMQLNGTLGGDILNALGGSGNFTVRDGRFPGLNMGNTAQTLAKLQRVITLGGTTGGFSGELTFRSIEGDLSIANGRVHSERIHVDSPQAIVDLRGSSGFDQTLSYDGNATLIRSGSGGGPSNPADAVLGVIGGVMKQTVGRISMPFAVRGTFSDPKIQPGRGIPGISTSSGTTGTAQQQQTQEPQQKKKSILDIFRKP